MKPTSIFGPPSLSASQEDKWMDGKGLKMEMGSSSGASGSSDSSLNGLKFGKKIYFEDVGSGGGGGGGAGTLSKAPVVAPPPVPVAPPQRKGKGVAQGGGGGQQQQPPRCQVEGCKVDLTGAKAYYCRHKVCGMHSKTPKVVVAGLEQRFCQQCSRFHQLHEFDQGKRSCRRRLAGHNERRRKPPPGPLSPRYGRLSASFHEDSSRFRSFLMDFTYPRPPPAPSRDQWPMVRASDRVASSAPWQGSLDASHGAALTHQYMQSPAHFATSQLTSGDCLAGATDSSCALSLLSTQPWAATAAPRNHAPAISSSSSLNNSQMGQQTVVGSGYMTNPWGFKGHGAVSGAHEIQHDMGLGHFDAVGNGQFSGELELALQRNRQCPDHGSDRSYDHSDNAMHWSL